MRYRIPLLAVTAIVLSTAAAQADLGDQLFKLLPDDGAASDYFGYSVAISGTTAVVGAPLDDDNGSFSGRRRRRPRRPGDSARKLGAVSVIVVPS